MPSPSGNSAEVGQYLFHYGYLARLIDDSELASIADPAVRTATRDAHREVYWKSLRLLKRDIDCIRRNRRRTMESREEWDFERLIADSARMTRMVWTLRIAGAAHTMRLPFMISTVRETCEELHRLMAAPLAPVPAGCAA